MSIWLQTVCITTLECASRQISLTDEDILKLQNFQIPTGKIILNTSEKFTTPLIIDFDQCRTKQQG